MDSSLKLFVLLTKWTWRQKNKQTLPCYFSLRCRFLLDFIFVYSVIYVTIFALYNVYSLRAAHFLFV